MSLKQEPSPAGILKQQEQAGKSNTLRRSLRVLILALLIIPIIVVWEVLNSIANNTDPAVAGRPLSNVHTHLHTIALGGKPGVVYLGTHYGLFISTDGGRSWPQQRGILNTLMVLKIAVSPTNPQALAMIGLPSVGLGGQAAIYFSSDGGNTWHSSSAPSGLSLSAYLFTIQAGAANSGNFFAFYEYAGWFETRDMGTHWYPVTSGTLSNMQSPSLLTDPANPNHLLLGGDAGLYESRDDGSHWHQITAVNGNVQNIVASTTSPRLIFCTTDQAIYRWREGSIQITRIANLPMTNPPTRLVVNATGSILYGLSAQDLWSSNDSGTTWKHRWQFDRGDLVALLVDPINPNRLYAGFFSPGRVMMSTDGGSSWEILTD